MARLQLSKATLSRERQNLASYKRYLPALEMKRQQLRQALKDREAQKAKLLSEIEETIRRVATDIPMLADSGVDLDGVAQLDTVLTEEKRLAGVPVPVVKTITITPLEWPIMQKPHWVMPVQQALMSLIRLRVESEVLALQVERLRQALRKITQRVNLFERVLIPKTQSNIKRIEVYLGDRAREAVVTAKISKKRLHAVLANAENQIGSEREAGGIVL